MWSKPSIKRRSCVTQITALPFSQAIRMGVVIASPWWFGGKRAARKEQRRARRRECMPVSSITAPMLNRVSAGSPRAGTSR
jgi:hypothetical protein